MQIHSSPVVILTDFNVRDMAIALLELYREVTGTEAYHHNDVSYDQRCDWVLKTYMPSRWPDLNLDDSTVLSQAFDLLMFAHLDIARQETIKPGSGDRASSPLQPNRLMTSNPQQARQTGVVIDFARRPPRLTPAG